MSLFKVENISIAFGGVKALNNVSFEVNEGEVFTIIGPNGAGKSTLFNVISRIYQPNEGKIYFATKGDNKIWCYDTNNQNIIVLYDHSTHPNPILSGVDNIVFSSSGDLFVAEDGGNMQIVAIDSDGSLVPILQIMGQDESEITGPAFDPSNERLYFSSQRGKSGSASDGVTYEVKGPFIKI